MDIYEQFVVNLYTYLLGVENCNNNIVKKHIRKLEQLGEFSVNSNVLKRFNSTINVDALQNVTTASLNWNLRIAKCILIEDTFHLYLDRPSTLSLLICNIATEGKNYGIHSLKLKSLVSIHTDFLSENSSTMNLSELRVILIKRVLDRLLSFVQNDFDNQNSVDIYLRCKSKKDTLKEIVCSPVLSSDKNELKAVDLYNKRTIDMRLMAEHKYGLRVTSNTGWRNIFRKLGEAAVTIELLQIKPNRSVICKYNDFSASCSKGASFILYNCARLATLLKEFQNRVELKTYPELPHFDEIDFTLLTQPEEWEISYGYLLQFPTIVHSCIKDIVESNIKIHNLCHHLSSMCSLFSVYYQRVRILTEPRHHLFSVLHARICLIRAVETVLHNGLYILGIEPVNQM